MTRMRCRYEVTRDILEALLEHDKGKGVIRSRLLLGRNGGSLNYQRLNPLLKKLSDAGLISVGSGRMKHCNILSKGRLWLSYFHQLERMVEER